jgi:hypothetical protein
MHGSGLLLATFLLAACSSAASPAGARTATPQPGDRQQVNGEVRDHCPADLQGHGYVYKGC